MSDDGTFLSRPGDMGFLRCTIPRRSTFGALLVYIISSFSFGYASLRKLYLQHVLAIYSRILLQHALQVFVFGPLLLGILGGLVEHMGSHAARCSLTSSLSKANQTEFLRAKDAQSQYRPPEFIMHNSWSLPSMSTSRATERGVRANPRLLDANQSVEKLRAGRFCHDACRACLSTPTSFFSCSRCLITIGRLSHVKVQRPD